MDAASDGKWSNSLFNTTEAQKRSRVACMGGQRGKPFERTLTFDTRAARGATATRLDALPTTAEEGAARIMVAEEAMLCFESFRERRPGVGEYRRYSEDRRAFC